MIKDVAFGTGVIGYAYEVHDIYENESHSVWQGVLDIIKEDSCIVLVRGRRRGWNTTQKKGNILIQILRRLTEIFNEYETN